MLILRAAQEIVAEDGFDEVLDNVRDRIDEIESLHRTRELTVSPTENTLTTTSSHKPFQFKDVDKGDMIRLSVDKGGADIEKTRPWPS